MKTVLNLIKKPTCRTAVMLSIICCFVFVQGCETVIVDDSNPSPAPKTKNYVRYFTSVDDVLFYIIGDEFISADLISDRDFDPLHPAGKSLNDIVVGGYHPLHCY